MNDITVPFSTRSVTGHKKKHNKKPTINLIPRLNPRHTNHRPPQPQMRVSPLIQLLRLPDTAPREPRPVKVDFPILKLERRGMWVLGAEERSEDGVCSGEGEHG